MGTYLPHPVMEINLMAKARLVDDLGAAFYCLS